MAKTSQFKMTRFYCNKSTVYKSKSVLTMNTGSPAQDQQNFILTSKCFSFYLELYKNEFKTDLDQ
jgi:hypothetical protein